MEVKEIWPELNRPLLAHSGPPSIGQGQETDKTIPKAAHVRKPWHDLNLGWFLLGVVGSGGFMVMSDLRG